jgi:hypothetical protein
MTFEEALAAADALCSQLSKAGIRFRVQLDDGAGLTAELASSKRPRRVPS